MSDQPHIVIIIPRGEAIRNFVYSHTLSQLAKHARVTMLSVVTDEDILAYARPHVEDIFFIEEPVERPLLVWLRHIIHYAHYRWQWAGVARNIWEVRDAQPRPPFKKLQRLLWKATIRLLAFQSIIRTLVAVENRLTWSLRPDDKMIELFKKLQPDLVFNTSHIHGPAGEYPAKLAVHMDIPVAGFIFSWDNLTSRSRLTVKYDHYLVWHQGMRDQLLSIYPYIKPEQVTVTGTPQMDFHFDPDYWMPYEELASEIGLDPARPFILWTTGIAHHFPAEHLLIADLIRLLDDSDLDPKPQLVVRTYVKDTSPEMMALAEENHPGVFFPPVLWEKQWYTPRYSDLRTLTNLLRHACLGINAASTVSLELLMQDKPVVNIGFDPPGSAISYPERWIRHIEFDHYWPVAQSGAVMVAYSLEEFREMVLRGLRDPQADSAIRQQYIKRVFGDTLDTNSGQRVADTLLELTRTKGQRI